MRSKARSGISGMPAARSWLEAFVSHEELHNRTPAARAASAALSSPEAKAVSKTLFASAVTAASGPHDKSEADQISSSTLVPSRTSWDSDRFSSSSQRLE